MTIATYSELVTEMESWLNRSDLSARIPTFIRLFEARMNRRLRSPDMEQSFSRSAIIGTDTYALNSRIRELREAYIEDDGTLNAYYDYTVKGESIVFDPAPETAFTFVYSGYCTLAGLSDSSTTNWLLDDHPDLYLFGSLARAEAYLKDDARVGFWKGAEDEALAEVIREANEKRTPAGPLQMPPPVCE